GESIAGNAARGPRIDRRGVGGARGGPAPERAAERESRHESDEHGGEGVHGMTEDEPEHAEPHHLIDEPGRSREEERRRDDEERDGHQAQTGLTTRGRESGTGVGRLTPSRAGSSAARRLAGRAGSRLRASHRRADAARREAGERWRRAPPSRSPRAPGTRWWR